MRQGTSLSRRGFVKGLAAIAAGPTIIKATALGVDGRAPASERITMGFIGVGNQGGGHLCGGAWTYLNGGYLGRDDTQILGVCDVNAGRREGMVKRCEAHYANETKSGRYKAVEGYLDFRDMIQRPDIDAVLIATPIWWHPIQTIMCAAAGKDVYCEKPTSLTIQEAKSVRAAIKRYGRIYQGGTQQRSEYKGMYRQACEYVRSGRIGQLKQVYSYSSGGAVVWGPNYGAGLQPLAKEFDLYLGPAPYQPPKTSLGAHSFGSPGSNWGQHHFDIVSWGIGGDDTGPVELRIDGCAVCKYANGAEVINRAYPDPTIGLGAGTRFVGEGGVVFVGTEGTIAVDRNQILSNPVEILKRPLGPDDTRLYYAGSHSGNFLDCIRSRKKTIVSEDVACRSASLMILVWIVEQLRRPLKWDPVKEEFINDDEANRMLSVAYRAPWHL